jgi:hypothetical protein
MNDKTAIGAIGATGETVQALAVATRQAYRHYVQFHSDYEQAESGTLTLWTMHTHCFDITGNAPCDITPYILVTAPTSEAGKSRIFDVARLLVRQPLVVVGPTPAALFYNIDLWHPTLMIDEADMLRQSKQLQEVLNAGFQPGTPILRRNATYNVFCPKIFTGITHENPPLTDATLTRCIQIPMRRKARDEPLARFHRNQAAREMAPIHGGLAEWALAARDRLEDADPKMPEGLSDRQEDMWAPLFAIADSIGTAWGEAAREWAVTLTRAIPKNPDPAVQILADVKKILDGWPGNRIPTADLARARNALEGRDYDEDLSPNRLSKRLGGFGLHPDKSPFRMAGKASPTQRGFTFRRGDQYLPAWADAFQRYGV